MWTKLKIMAVALAALGWTFAAVSVAELHRLAHRIFIGPPPDSIFDAHERRWARAMLWFGGFEVSLAAPPPARGDATWLVVSNHRSAVDIPVLLTEFSCSILSHAGVSRWPIVGLAARRAQTIFVTREDKKSRSSALRGIRAMLRRGRSVSLFPEGTTFTGDEVRPFRRGAFGVTQGLEVQLVPVGLAYAPGEEFVEDSFGEHVMNIGRRGGGRVAMSVGAPIPAPAEAAEAADLLQAAVQAEVRRARAHFEARWGSA